MVKIEYPEPQLPPINLHVLPDAAWFYRNRPVGPSKVLPAKPMKVSVVQTLQALYERRK